MVRALAKLDPDYAKGRFDLGKIDPIRRAFRNHYMVEIPINTIDPVAQELFKRTGGRLTGHVYYNPTNHTHSGSRKRTVNIPII